MYEYFGVGPQVQKDVDGINLRFLRWLPKYCLSIASKHSLEIWHTVIDNLIMADVSLSSSFLCGGFWCLVVVWSSFHFWFFCDF